MRAGSTNELHRREVVGGLPGILLCEIGTTSAGTALREILGGEPQLAAARFEVVLETSAGFNDLAETLRSFHPSILLLNLAASTASRQGACFQELRAELEACPVIVVTDGLDPASLYGLLRLGASDFLTLPLKASEVVPRVLRLLAYQSKRDPLVEAIKAEIGLRHIVGESAVLVNEISKIPRIARCDATVLISGETGTGKEVFARSVHYLSVRSNQPFVAVNCGALPCELVENELFGHEPGAFTGAAATQTGVIEEAVGGTLFLDEIDTLPVGVQVKLLRFLQDKSYRRLGSQRSRQADLRVIAASNVKFEEAVRLGRFRQDLFYRLNVLTLALPPLRDRREDIPLLSRHFAGKSAAELHRPLLAIDAAAMHKMCAYSWPGNVRELENVIYRAVAMAEESTIRAQDISLPRMDPGLAGESFRALKAQAVEQFERAYLQTLLQESDGNISAAARVAQKNRRAFWELLRKHELLPCLASRR